MKAEPALRRLRPLPEKTAAKTKAQPLLLAPPSAPTASDSQETQQDDILATLKDMEGLESGGAGDLPGETEPGDRTASYEKAPENNNEKAPEDNNEKVPEDNNEKAPEDNNEKAPEDNNEKALEEHNEKAPEDINENSLQWWRFLAQLQVARLLRMRSFASLRRKLGSS